MKWLVIVPIVFAIVVALIVLLEITNSHREHKQDDDE
jgi:hypothetical protein